MKAEVPPAGSTIPTFLDLMERVEMDMVDCAGGRSTDDQMNAVAGTIAELFTSRTATEIDLFNRIACARGCHAMAEVYQEKGDHRNAGLYHALGQDMLMQAGNTFATIMAAGVSDFVTTH